MLAWSEELITDGETRNHGYDVIVGGELLLITPITLANLSHGETQINRRRTLPLLSRWWDAYRKQLGLKDFSPKSQDAACCSRLRSVALYL